MNGELAAPKRKARRTVGEVGNCEVVRGIARARYGPERTRCVRYCDGKVSRGTSYAAAWPPHALRGIGMGASSVGSSSIGMVTNRLATPRQGYATNIHESRGHRNETRPQATSSKGMARQGWATARRRFGLRRMAMAGQGREPLRGATRRHGQAAGCFDSKATARNETD